MGLVTKQDNFWTKWSIWKNNSACLCFSVQSNSWPTLFHILTYSVTKNQILPSERSSLNLSLDKSKTCLNLFSFFITAKCMCLLYERRVLWGSIVCCADQITRSITAMWTSLTWDTSKGFHRTPGGSSYFIMSTYLHNIMKYFMDLERALIKW